MAFVYETIPPGERERVRFPDGWGKAPMHWVADRDNRVFLVHMSVQPERNRWESYPQRFLVNIEGKILVFDAFRERSSMKGVGDTVRWYGDVLVMPRGFAKRVDALHETVAEAMRTLRDVKDREAVAEVLVSPGRVISYGMLGWSRACPDLFRSGRQRIREAPTIRTRFAVERIQEAERHRLGPLESICCRVKEWAINREYNAVLVEVPSETGGDKGGDNRRFALIIGDHVLFLAAHLYQPHRLPYIHDGEEAEGELLPASFLKTFRWDHVWLAECTLTIPEALRERTKGLSRWMEDALTGKYSIPRGLPSEERVSGAHIQIDHVDYYSRDIGELCAELFPKSHTDFVNRPLSLSERGDPLLLDAISRYGHAHIADYIDYDNNREKTICEWHQKTVNTRLNMDLMWLGPVVAEKRESVHDGYLYCLHSARERFVIHYRGDTLFLDAFFHATGGWPSLRIRWHGGILHMPESLKGSEDDIRGLILAGLIAHGRYYRRKLAGTVTLDLHELRYYADGAQLAKGVEGVEPLERYALTRPLVVLDGCLASLELCREKGPVGEWFPYKNLSGPFKDPFEWWRDEVNDIYFIRYEWPVFGNEGGEGTDSYFMKVKGDAFAFKGITFTGTVSPGEELLFFDTVSVTLPNGWESRLDEALTLFRHCLGGTKEMHPENIHVIPSTVSFR